MQNRFASFTTLLIVIGVSIIFGMVLGGRLNTPHVALAAPDTSPIQLAPAVGGTPVVGFADIVENALPAVVGVTSQRRANEPAQGQRNPFFEDPFFRRWFGDPQDPEQQPEPGPRIGAGSGFIISPDGYILTNNHVVENAAKVEIRTQGEKTYEAQVVGTDPSIDLALLKIDPGSERLPTLPLGDSAALRVGEWVIAIGNPLEFEQTVTAGVVSGKNRRLASLPTDIGVASFIQTDAAINFGNSGGPLLDGRGNVVGINTAIRRANFAEGIGFALPINKAREVMEQLRETGKVRRGYIGIRMNQTGLDEAAAEYYGLPDSAGVIVSDVTRGGPAADAGLRPGDIIREVDGEKVENNLDLISKIASRRPGDRVRLEVFREGETFSTRATLGDRESGLEEDGGRLSRPDDSPEPEPEPEPQTASAFGLTVENPSDRVLQRLGFEPGREGVVVTDVEFGSAAASKGIAPNMLVVAVNDRPTPDVASWKAVLDELGSGRALKIDVVVMAQGAEQSLYFFLRTDD